VSALGKRLAIQPTNRLTSFIKTSARLTLSLNSELDSVVTLELVVLVVWVVLVVFLQVTSSVMHASLLLRLWGMHLFSRHDFLTAIFSPTGRDRCRTTTTCSPSPHQLTTEGGQAAIIAIALLIPGVESDHHQGNWQRSSAAGVDRLTTAKSGHPKVHSDPEVSSSFHVITAI